MGALEDADVLWVELGRERDREDVAPVRDGQAGRGERRTALRLGCATSPSRPRDPVGQARGRARLRPLTVTSSAAVGAVAEAALPGAQAGGRRELYGDLLRLHERLLACVFGPADRLVSAIAG